MGDVLAYLSRLVRESDDDEKAVVGEVLRWSNKWSESFGKEDE